MADDLDSSSWRSAASSHSHTTTSGHNRGGSGGSNGGRGEVLSLDKRGLKVLIPQFFTDTRGIRSVSLADNQLQAIPQRVLQPVYDTLLSLSLSRNQLCVFPEEILELRCLESLAMVDNKLQELPNALLRLRHLKHLDVSQNKLRELPDAMVRMENLTTLKANINMLSELPVDIGNAPRLRGLGIHSNYLEELPTSIARLELQELATEWLRYVSPPLPRNLSARKGDETAASLLKKIREVLRSWDGPHIGFIDFVGQLSEKPFDVNGTDRRHCTRLHFAVRNNDMGVAYALLRDRRFILLNASQSDNQLSALTIATQNQNVELVKRMIKAGGNVSEGAGVYGSPLHVAVANFDRHLVAALLKAGANVVVVDSEGNNALHVLFSVYNAGERKTSEAIARMLLGAGVRCNQANCEHWTPLHMAARRSQHRAVSFAVQWNRSHPACTKGDCQHQHGRTDGGSGSGGGDGGGGGGGCVSVFDMNLRGGVQAWTPLMLACHASSYECGVVFIDGGADPLIRTSTGQLARHIAKGNAALAKLLKRLEEEIMWFKTMRQHGPRPSLPPHLTQPHDPSEGEQEHHCTTTTATNSPTHLHHTQRVEVIGGEEAAFDAFISDAIVAHFDEPFTDTEDDSSPANSTTNGHQADQRVGGRVSWSHDAAKRMAERGRFSLGELERLQETFGVAWSPKRYKNKLFDALCHKRVDRYVMLATHSVPKADPSLLLISENEASLSLWATACTSGDEDLVRTLAARHTADGGVSLGAYRTPCKHDSLLHLLCKPKTRRRALHAHAGPADILRFLLEVFPGVFDLSAENAWGLSPLHLAVMTGDACLVFTLLECGADPTHRDCEYGWTPLHVAAFKGHALIVLLLLYFTGTNPDQNDRSHWSPLFEAAARRDIRTIAILANRGCDLHAQVRDTMSLKQGGKSVDILAACERSAVTSIKEYKADPEFPSLLHLHSVLIANGVKHHTSPAIMAAIAKEGDREVAAAFDAETRTYLSRRSQGLWGAATSGTDLPPFFIPSHLCGECVGCGAGFTLFKERVVCRNCGVTVCPSCCVTTVPVLPLLEQLPRMSPAAKGSLHPHPPGLPPASASSPAITHIPHPTSNVSPAPHPLTIENTRRLEMAVEDALRMRGADPFAVDFVKRDGIREGLREGVPGGSGGGSTRANRETAAADQAERSEPPWLTMSSSSPEPPALFNRRHSPAPRSPAPQAPFEQPPLPSPVEAPTSPMSPQHPPLPQPISLPPLSPGGISDSSLELQDLIAHFPNGLLPTPSPKRRSRFPNLSPLACDSPPSSIAMSPTSHYVCDGDNDKVNGSGSCTSTANPSASGSSGSDRTAAPYTPHNNTTSGTGGGLKGGGNFGGGGGGAERAAPVRVCKVCSSFYEFMSSMPTVASCPAKWHTK
ncbi:unnamed protein product [Vitrella brassicaformis CCMP3155]|uniref:FYVE zinc finger domain-containing protein n=1 Tax=Vitrella brassicaformis (strain CCMP3155) TaxID=1169540 RepID=A0A0G4G9T3_VITBC|nr:unnamed protein product [Vitrella brassicaformis CCMP3155]|eukprot:CEM25284.1 unnamed protein product [Vitrella brassicaformis CCMP3155]